MATSQSDLIPLPHVCSALRAEYGDAPSYLRLYRVVVGGVISAHQVHGRWMLDRSVLPDIARHFGIDTPQAT